MKSNVITDENYDHTKETSKWLNADWNDDDDDAWFHKAKRPERYQFDDDGGGGPRHGVHTSMEEDKDAQEYIDDVEAAAQEHEIIDWVFKCVTLTLLSLILICAIIILVKVWNINSTTFNLDETMSGSKSASVIQPYRYDPRVTEETTSRSQNGLSNRLINWITTSGFGKTGSKLLSIPAFIIRSVLNIILAPLKFICSKMIYFLYICGFMLCIMLFFYWVLHAFLSQTLGEWFVKRLRLPSPQQLVHDFAVFVGYAFFNRWWSLTELIKEKILTYFNTYVMDGDRGRGYGGSGLGFTPGPMRRRTTSIWGSRPGGMRGSVMSNRNSIHYPKPNVYTGLGAIDQKRRLQTINETTGDQLAGSGLYGRAGSNRYGYGTSINNEKSNPIINSRIHNSPGGRADPYSFDNYDKPNVNDVIYKPRYGTGLNNSNAGGGVVHSPIRAVNSNVTNRAAAFGNHVAQRNVQRQQQKTETNLNGSKLGVPFRGGVTKKGGMAFNL